MSKDWSPADCVEWTYERDEGDIVVYARNANEALHCMREHGFTYLDKTRLKRTGLTLSERLKSAKEGHH